MPSPFEGVTDTLRQQHKNAEEEALQQQSLSRDRKGMKKTTLVQALLFLSLALLQQKAQSAAAAEPVDLKSTTPHPPKTKVKQGTIEKDGSLAMEDSSCVNDELKKAKRWDPVEEIQKSEEGLDDSSVLERYYEPRFLYRDEETVGSKRRNYYVNEDVLVVTSVDGTFAGVSRSTGKTLWRRSQTELRQMNYLKTEDGENEIHLFDPLVATTTTTRSSSSQWKTSAVPSIDGRVHLTAPLQDGGDEVTAPEDRTDVTVTTTVNELVSRAPFVDNRGRIYTGTRKTLAVAIDSSTGEVLQVVSADAQCSNENSFGEDRQVTWLGRVDQSITIQDPKTGNLDVRFSAGQIMSVNDMVLGSGARQPWGCTNDRLDQLLPEGKDNEDLPSFLLATPSGALAYMDPKTSRVKWIAEDFFDSPVAFAVDAASGVSLPVNIVPDAAMSNGSTEYLIQEIERQVRLLGDEAATSLGVDEQTIFGTLPSGQLYAMPLGGMLPKVLNGRNESPSAPQQHRHQLGSVSYAPHRSSEAKFSATQPAGKATCRPGSPGFPACLVGSAEWKDPFARPLALPLEDSSVVPFYHPDFGYIPPEHFYTLHQNPSRRKYRKLLKILESWVPATVVLIFVLSFQLGRRKRLKDIQKELVSNEIITADVHESASGSNHFAGGVIQVYDDIILGYGGHGTVVYKGMLDGREVAVKRMLKAYHASADREISLLIESDGHPNVVRYFLKEVRGDFVYLALELCDLSLHDLIANLKSRFDQENQQEVRSLVPTSTRTILYQLACGVRHLHRLRIVHRDLKPANILLAKSTKGKGLGESVHELFERGQYVAKISDMGLGKQVLGQSSYGASMLNEASLIGQSNGAQPSVTGAGPGSVGWQAPEVMALRVPSDASNRSDGSNMMSGDSNPDSSQLEAPVNARTSRSVDIFSLGCIFYATLVPGSHPFGEWYEREANVMRNRPSINELEDRSPDAHDLVSAMIQRNPLLRPTAKQICEHPFFWAADRRLTFLCDFSDRLELEGDESNRAAYLLAVEQGAAQIVGTSWDRALDDELLSNVQRFRTYDPSSVRDLLRLIRNKYHHFDELPTRLKEAMQSKAEGLQAYFETRFPRLLIHCYRICRERMHKVDPLCTKYAITDSGPAQKFKRVECQVPLIEVNTDGENEETAKQRSGIEPAAGVEAEASLVVVSKPDLLQIEDQALCPPSSSIDISHPGAAILVEETVSRGQKKVSPFPDDVGDVVIWHASSAAKTFNCRGWNRSDGEWERRVDSNLRRRDSNLVRCATDPKFRTRLCNHWDASNGTFCPMRKKNKCVFAHGPVELRVKEGKRNRWGKLVDANGDNKNPRHSGGEDTYGAARSIETERKQEGKWNTNKSPASSKGKSKQQTLRGKKNENVSGQAEVVASG